MLINMDDEASLELTHSRILFVDDGGNPMRFYMVPCQEKSAVKPLIEVGLSLTIFRSTGFLWAIKGND